MLRFMVFWEKSILITQEIRGSRINLIEESKGWGLGTKRRMPPRQCRGRDVVLAKGWDSEQECFLAPIWWQAQTHLRRAVGAFDG